MMRRMFIVATLVFAFIGEAAAQGNGGPLTIQGLHQQHNPSAASRGFGGVSIGTRSNIELMFANPAAMQGLPGIRVSIAGVQQYRDQRQDQRFAPVRYFPNLSLLLENMTDRIPDPDPELVGFTPADSVQRPFDDIQPNWSRSGTSNRPLHALLAVPFSFGGVNLVAGAGAIQHANLDHFYQNNNVLDPDVLTQRPLPALRPTDDNPLTANWYQTVRSREGSLYGYGLSLAGHLERYNLTLGISGLRLDGETDDFESQTRRGVLTFFSNEFRADSASGQTIVSGTSTYSGTELSFGAQLGGRYVSAGVVVRPPTTITRSFIRTSGGSAAISGEDKLQLPWRGTAGITLRPRERLRIGLEYEIRPYASATYTSTAEEESEPWESSSLFRIGGEYQLFSWLAIRGGMREEADVFVPEGSALVDEPVSWRVYSAGLGLSFAGLQWNMAFEQGRMNYQDIWGTALSSNRDLRRTIVADVSYTLPLR